jgi:hypothetical protein
MKKLIASLAVFTILLALLLAGCSLDDPADPTGQVNDPGPADASTPYVAIGNSLTAGFMDSGLIEDGQKNSYPMIVAQQMGLESLSQPTVAYPGIGTTGAQQDGHTSGVLYYDGQTVAPLAEYPTPQAAALLKNVGNPRQYNNLGVPTAFMVDYMNCFSAATSYTAVLAQILPDRFKPNSYFEFINRAGPLVNLFKNVEVPDDPPKPGYQTGSQFYQTIAQGPALVTAWIGGNDPLFGAASGDPLTTGNPLITPPEDFDAMYAGFLHSLAGGLLKKNGFPPTIVTATLPYIRHFPYFINRPTFEAVFGPVFGPFTYDEPATEYILFTSWIGAGFPAILPTNLTLDTAERAYLDDDIIGAYNTTIQTVTAQVNGNPDVPANAVCVDMGAALDVLAGDNPEALQHFLFLRIIHSGEPIADTAARTYFSLDGIHPNNQGYVYFANQFLGGINLALETDYAPADPAAVIYDPTYGKEVKAADGMPRISPEAAAAMAMGLR